ncbi:transmembrane protein 14A [Pristis pectinata]|uniref:transmembrane protein 14A n=1 Tax=Pristis pectinata TaxID=685728 RepID=UPI00223D8D54|nr:transmembrane protein 14A [Pristis pectinata]
MPVDWISYSYAGVVTVSGIIGYMRRGSLMSLITGLLFGSLAGYGAYQTSNDPQNVRISLITAGVLTVAMGMRYQKSGRLIPAGLVAGFSLLMILRLVIMMF